MNIGLIPEKYARLTPDAEALIDRSTGQRLSFAKLDEHVKRLANGLLSLGLTTGDRVAILSHNSIEFAALYFACGRAGLVSQPLNWRLAEPELAKIMADGKPSVLLSQSQFSDVVKALRLRETSVSHWFEFGHTSDGSYDAFIAAAPDSEPIPPKAVEENDSLYILYTGGSTGASKGVLHTHKSTFYAMMTNVLGERIDKEDVYMLTGPMFHSPVVMAMTYLACGRPVVLLTFEAKEAMRAIQEERVTAFIGQPTMVTRLVALEDFDTYDVSSLRHIMYGGGPVPATTVRATMERFKCNLIGVYGQTEGIAMTFLSYEDHLNAIKGIHPERLNSCGRETFLTSLRIVDEGGAVVPKDGSTIGQIIVQSQANMVEYWQRPDLTRQTLRDGWMWTGDLATWDEDGYVFIVDRAKDMIISGGENIYSIQVEEAICRHPAVLEAAVIGVPDPEWGEAVKAFVVLKQNATASEQEIIDLARGHLASYQKPRSIEFIAALPVAVTGKVMKNVLRAPYWVGRTRKV